LLINIFEKVPQGALFGDPIYSNHKNFLKYFGFMLDF